MAPEPSHSPSSWFRDTFNEDYPTIYAGRDQGEAEAGVELAVRELGLDRQTPVLDVCCGFGRHLRAFRRRGIPAVGIDLSLALLARVDRGDGVEVVRGDLRRLPFSGGATGFAAWVNFFTSFGYFEDECDHRRAARELARMLRPGGRFLMDLLNAPPAIRGLQPWTEREVAGTRITEERSYDASTRRMEKTTTLRPRDAGETKRYFESVRLFTSDEISSLLEGEGLRVEKMVGDFSGTVFGDDTPRMILLGKRSR